ncbi:MAG TPA: type II secretion system F family protein [Planctomycetaceae bacterium]|nr:type II secretion system F family protein [Planctomycetaceae bacterium]
MPIFTYEAVDSSARNVGGRIAADSPREAREKLRAQGYLIETIQESETRAAGRQRLFERPRRYAAQVTGIIRDLSTLLATGINLADALDTLVAQYQGRLQASLLGLRERVTGGSSLSQAMEDEPTIYDELTIEMVRVGENSGTLDKVLDRLAEFRERYLMFKDRVTTALIYPSIVVGLAVAVSIFLMTVVLPMLLENLIASGQRLPWPTRVLKGMSDLATSHGLLLFLIFGTVVGGFAGVARTSWGRRRWHKILFRAPLLGSLVQKQEIARAAIVISTLMKNGIVFVEAVRIAGRVSKNVLLKEALEEIRERVQAGRDIGDALVATHVFPPLVALIFNVGQQTGKLEEMLDKLAEGYERQVASATARLTAAVEPILIVVLAVFVGFIVFATILPIMEAGNVL